MNNVNHSNKKETRVYAPSYYFDFKCIADRCRHSCCIDWQVCIDEATYEKYKNIDDIIDTTEKCDDGFYFKLCDSGRCPHLNEAGLCNIIISQGEDFLSDICKNHPRFFNFISSERIEAGLGIVCEEACRLILENERPFFLSTINTTNNFDANDIDDSDFNVIPYRDHIVSIIEKDACDFIEKITELKAKFKIPELFSFDKWIDRLLALEILDYDWKHTLLSAKKSCFICTDRCLKEYGKYYERLLLYFVYRHVSTAIGEENLRARLGFAILCVDIIRCLFEGNTIKSLETLIDTARRFSAEIEYSEDNTAELVFEFESSM